MKKLFFATVLIGLVSFSVFSDDFKYFIGSWFWSRGDTQSISKNEKKVFTLNGEFKTFVLKNKNTYDLDPVLTSTFTVDSDKKLITFHNEYGDYVFKYIFSNNYKTFLLLDMTIQENPETRCYKLED